MCVTEFTSLQTQPLTHPLIYHIELSMDINVC